MKQDEFAHSVHGFVPHGFIPQILDEDSTTNCTEFRENLQSNYLLNLKHMSKSAISQ